ncbi:hypothetical protein CKAH01_08790 [Colletotrichum kahawae]|uniref:Uncharacterized protein n=1 Tax=Colletotrichum kahawae TaxID=34407 RepID=A0AAD9Y239_COLKA|nr:hypothetical protein CKAH01_08790 [Colletotrichum kahawae]
MAHNAIGKGNEIYHLVSPATQESDISTSNLSSVAPPSAPRSRYWTRTIIGLLVPLTVTGYYYWIWRYLLSRSHDDAIKFGSATEIWVYYSWFIIGVFALEWSKHGLVGVEVAMLETKTFGASHLVALLSHSEGTWSGPGGWFKCITKAFRKNQSGSDASLGDSLKTYKLWYILAFISLSLYVGMPLSGLTMELSDGYVRLEEAPMVVGRNSTTFHGRTKITGTIDKAAAAWTIGSPTTLPGIGIIYTPDYFDREGHEALSNSPNLLPTEQGIPEMFIVPQALVPMSGRPWGLRIGYNCSIVEDVSKFTVLGRYTELCDALGSSLSNSTRTCAKASVSIRVTNIWSYSEVGTRMNVEERQKSDGTAGETQVNVLQWAIWQVRAKAPYIEIENFNTTVGPVVQGIGSPFMKASNGSWVMNTAFFEQKKYVSFNTTQKIRIKLHDSDQAAIDVAAAIGVRCVVRSVFGSAMVDARTSSFSDFRTENPTFHPEVNGEPMSRLGIKVASMTEQATLEDIFTSINTGSMSTMLSNSAHIIRFLTSRDLWNSVYLAWGQEVLSQMYDNHYGFEDTWPYTNLTSSKKGKVLTKGEVPPLVAVIPFGIWALGSCALGILFGFRRRLADSLNGFSFFRFGVYSADKLKTEGILNAKEAEDVATLWHLPGTLEKRPTDRS